MEAPNLVRKGTSIPVHLDEECFLGGSRMLKEETLNNAGIHSKGNKRVWC